jgi:hypothetical protein
MITTAPQYPLYTDESSGQDTPDFVLAGDVLVMCPRETPAYVTTIPTGFSTDFGSVPKLARSIITNVSVYDRAYLLHDWMYSTLYNGPAVSFTKVNRMLRANLRYLGMSYFDAYLVFWAVELFGKSHWRVNA